MCKTEFKSLAAQMFRARSSIPIYGFLLTLWKDSKYRTEDVEKTLQDTFSYKKLFADVGRSSYGASLVHRRLAVKVAVTSTDGLGSNCVVMSNYNRKDLEGMLCA